MITETSSAQRNSNDIRLEILKEIAYQPRTRTYVCQSVRTSFATIKAHEHWLADNGLITVEGTLLSITNKGVAWMAALEAANEILQEEKETKESVA